MLARTYVVQLSFRMSPSLAEMIDVKLLNRLTTNNGPLG